MTLFKLQEHSRRLVLEYRNQDRIIQSESFEEAWNSASREKRTEISCYLQHPNVDKVKKWIKDVSKHGYQSLTVKELRVLASYFRVSKYSRLHKEQLIKEIEDHEARELDTEKTISRDETALACSGRTT